MGGDQDQPARRRDEQYDVGDLGRSVVLARQDRPGLAEAGQAERDGKEVHGDLRRGHALSLKIRVLGFIGRMTQAAVGGCYRATTPSASVRKSS
jgi:hypothetical protein